jgi:uncharacterized protein (TIGR02145 family)
VNSALTQNCDLFLSEYGEGTGTTRFLEIFNPTGNVVDLSIYRLGRCVNGCDINGILDFTDFSFPLDAVLLPGAVFTIAHPSSTAAILAVADTTSTTVVGNGDDAVALVKADGDVTVILDVVGTLENTDPGSGWNVAGIASATADRTLVRKSNVLFGNQGNWSASAGTNVTNSEWEVYLANTSTYFGSHVLGSNLCGAPCTLDTDGDGVCNSDEVWGCTEADACNFNPAATENSGCLPDGDGDGVCDVNEVVGCQISTLCNYNPNATDAGVCFDDADADGICDNLDACIGQLDACGVCNGPGPTCGNDCIPEGECDCFGNQLDALGQCGGACVADVNSNNVCDICETPSQYTVTLGGGSFADERGYKIVAPNGTVVYQTGEQGGPTSQGGTGCVVSANAAATALVALNAGTTYTIIGYDCYGDGWNNGQVRIRRWSDNLYVLGTAATGVTFTTSSCTGGCYQQVGGGTARWNFTTLAASNATSESCGCTAATACNYNPAAIYDNGSCQYAGCMDADACNYLACATVSGPCDYTSCVGCMDEFSAFNYNPSATQSGTCAYCQVQEPPYCYENSLPANNILFSYSSPVLGISVVFDQGYIEGFSWDKLRVFKSTALTAENLIWQNGTGDTNVSGLEVFSPSGTIVATLQTDGSRSCASGDFEPLQWSVSWDCNAIGCMDATACNFNPGATIQGSSCDYTCQGCTDSSACNFNPDATLNVGCEYPVPWYWDEDSDGLGSQEQVVFACLNNAPEGYVLLSGDECPFSASFQTMGPCSCDEVVDSDADGVADCIDLCSDLTACNFDDAVAPCDFSCTCNDPAACNFGAVIGTQSAVIVAQPIWSNFDFNGYGGQGPLWMGNSSNGGLLLGWDSWAVQTIVSLDSACWTFEPGNNIPGWFEGLLLVHAIDHLSGITLFHDTLELSNSSEDLVEFCLNTLGSCSYATSGYDCSGTCLNDADGDGVCNEFEIEGCTIASACNYNVTATDNDGSCTFAESGYDCSGTCLSDLDDDGICADDEICGCTDVTATNYIAESTENDGSCLYPSNAACGNLTTIAYDGYAYPLVAIGNQCWFRENLRSDNYRNGDAIPGGLSNSQWVTTTQGAQSIYDNSDSNFSIYGRLYNWYAVSDFRGLCPVGFHVPSTLEWDVLSNALGGANAAGLSLKSSPCNVPPWTGNNSSRFTALPSGFRDITDGSGHFSSAGNYGIWWASSRAHRLLSSGQSIFYSSGGTIIPTYGYSVRCVMDAGFACNDLDNDGVCDQFEILGCTNPEALNFDPAATDDDGSCLLPNSQPCGNQSAVVYDGHTYPLVTIGTQCWFKENLQTDNYRNGDPIPGNLSNSQWTSTNTGAQSVYGDTELNLTTIGRLYNWYAVNDPRGICPANWHVGTDEEWTTLEQNLGVSAGETLKAPMPAWDGSGSSGFLALPGGRRTYDGGAFEDAGMSGNWWTSSSDSSDAWMRYLISGNSGVGRYNDSYNFKQRNGFSVRCVMDAEFACNDLDNDGVCDENEPYGCTDPVACNFLDVAAEDDGSCTYPAAGYDCNGVCLQDTDSDGVCNEHEVPGCTEPTACNFEPTATDEDGSCVFDSGSVQLIVEPVAVHNQGALEGLTTYRLFAQIPSASQRISAVFGNDNYPLMIAPSQGGVFYQDTTLSASSQFVPTHILGIFPQMAFDSYVALGKGHEHLTTSVQTLSSSTEPWEIAFESGLPITIESSVGGGWFSIDPEDGLPLYPGNKVLLGQFTTEFGIEGRLSLQVTGCANGSSLVYHDLLFASISSSLGCTDSLACNYEVLATIDDESCCFGNCFGPVSNPEALIALPENSVVLSHAENSQSNEYHYCLSNSCYLVQIELETIPLPQGANPTDWAHGVLNFSSQACTGCLNPESCNYSSTALASGEVCVELISDLDHDGEVGVSDILILLSEFQSCYGAAQCFADINNDNLVNVADLLIFLSEFGNSCSDLLPN